MTPQERDVIAGIFDRLKQAADQPRDPEAENYIAQRLREQPYAPYAMAQAVYVQEQSLLNLNEQVEALQAEVRELQARASQPQAQPAASGGFLSGIFGGAPQPRAGSVPSFPQRGRRSRNSRPRPSLHRPGTVRARLSQQWVSRAWVSRACRMGQPGPWQNQPPQAPGRGGGFMASALTTAAGVAGGMMLGNVLTNAFGGGKSADAAKPAETASATDAAKPDAGATETASTPAAADSAAAGESAPAYQPASYEEPMDPGYDDGSFGGDDDSWA